jgi:hypothetical protein
MSIVMIVLLAGCAAAVRRRQGIRLLASLSALTGWLACSKRETPEPTDDYWPRLPLIVADSLNSLEYAIARRTFIHSW